MAEDLIVSIINHPAFTIAVIGVIAYFILKEWNKGKLKPEQKPDFGVRYRAERVKKHFEVRDKYFAVHVKGMKAFLFRDLFPLGRVVSVEDIPHKVMGKDKKEINVTLTNMVFRRFGLWNWIKAKLGFGLQRILMDNDAWHDVLDTEKKIVKIIIDKECYFRERGGVFVASKIPDVKFIDEINADKDYENTKGFVSDFPRRLSNLHPAHASKTDSQELEWDLDQKTEDKKRFAWGKGG